MPECNDVNCPKHGSLKVRGASIDGVVVSDKAKNTVIIKRHYLHFVPKYERYERRSTRIAAHRPPCVSLKVGDKVTITECKRISKTKAFVVTHVEGAKK